MSDLQMSHTEFDLVQTVSLDEFEEKGILLLTNDDESHEFKLPYLTETIFGFMINDDDGSKAAVIFPELANWLIEQGIEIAVFD